MTSKGYLNSMFDAFNQDGSDSDQNNNASPVKSNDLIINSKIA